MNDMELTLEIARTLDDKRALDLVALDVRHLTVICMCMPWQMLSMTAWLSSVLNSGAVKDRTKPAGL